MFTTSSVLPLLVAACLLLCVPCCRGQTCSSIGQWTEGSCSRSRPCRAEHPSEDAECVLDANIFTYPPSFPEGVSWCQRQRDWTFGCDAPVPAASDHAPPANTTRVALVGVDLSALSYSMFAMNVSWEHAHDPTSAGYEVRVSRDHALVQCYCVSDPQARGLYLDHTLVYPSFSYQDTGSSLEVEVTPLVGSAGGRLSEKRKEEDLGARVTSEWPASCLDIDHSNETCGLPVYHPPSDLIVYKLSRSRRVALDVHWNYKTAYAQPSLYYLEVYDAHNRDSYFTFVANNTRSVRIGQLDSSVRYRVRVLAYRHCSGLAHRTYGLGCGLWSRPVSPVSADSHSPLLLYSHVKEEEDLGGKKS